MRQSKGTARGIGKAGIILVLSVVCIAFAAAAGAQESNEHAKGGNLQGTWRVWVQQRDCTTNAALGPTFLSLLTFNQGGTMTETTANWMFYPAVRGPGHGTWSRVTRPGTQDPDDPRYSASSLALITLNGVLVQEQIITQAIKMGEDGNTFRTTAASVQFFKPDGTLLRQGCATARATRF